MAQIPYWVLIALEGIEADTPLLGMIVFVL